MRKGTSLGLPTSPDPERTLAKLYNQRPAWLAQAHAVLDPAVADMARCTCRDLRRYHASQPIEFGKPMKPSEALASHRAAILAATVRFRTTNPRVFGSVLQGTDSDNSNLDLLVAPLPSTTLFDFLGGCK